MFSTVQIIFRTAFDSSTQTTVLGTVNRCCPHWQLVSNDYPNPSLILCIGGDGTLLRGIKARARKDTPLLGINVGGHLGYLTADTDLERALLALNQERYSIVEKTMVCAVVKTREHEVAKLEALNEIVLRGENNKPIEIKVAVAGSTVESVFGDGLMISTPTGSTAYNLSVGGPLVDALCQVLLITPIAPIDLNIRPIVIPDIREITLSLKVWPEERKFIFADREELTLSPGAYDIVVSKAKHPLRVVEFPSIKGSFFQILHDRTLGQR